MKKTAVVVWLSTSLIAVSAANEASAASKFLYNNSDAVMYVQIFARIGGNPDNGQRRPVRAKLSPNSSLLVNYGNDRNPFLNELFVKVHAGGAAVAQSFKVSVRGSSLDGLFNTNDTISLDYDPETFQFSLAGSNTAP